MITHNLGFSKILLSLLFPNANYLISTVRQIVGSVNRWTASQSRPSIGQQCAAGRAVIGQILTNVRVIVATKTVLNGSVDFKTVLRFCKGRLKCFASLLPLDEAAASRAVFVIVSWSGGRTGGRKRF